MSVEEPKEEPAETVFATWNHNRKKVRQDTVKVTENFNSKYCISVGGYGIVDKALLSTSQSRRMMDQPVKKLSQVKSML